MNILKGSTDVTTYVNLVDSAAGTPETGLTITNIDATYTRNRAAAVKNDLTAMGAANSAHADNQGIEVDSANAPGIYRIDWPDAAFATGVDKVVLTVTCSGCAPASIVVQLINYNPEDGTRLGLAALPNAAADGAGGLPISDAGGLDLDQIGTRINDILTDTGTTLQGELDGIQADTEDIQARLPAALTADGNIKADTLRLGGTVQTGRDIGASVLVGDKTGFKLASDGVALITAWTVAITGNVTGNLSGSVGSVAGTVGGIAGTTQTLDALQTALNSAHGAGSWATATSVTVSDKTGFKLASDGIDLVVVETGLNARQALSIIAASSAGVLSGAATTTILVRAAGVPGTTRLTGTVDSDGNRSAVALSLPV